jgi:Ca-activated chloride channel homolog
MASPFLFARSRCVLVIVLLSLTAIACGQTQSAAIVPKAFPMYDAHPRSVRVNVNLVLVPVNVIDSLHHPVIDLDQKDFELFEGNDPQQIRYFYREDAPISIALVLDTSGSMGKRMDLLRDAVDQFFANANPKDDYTVITVSDRPEVMVRGTRSIDEIQATLAIVKPAGWTALLDSVRLAAIALKNAKYPRRVILIVSDGMDNVSRHNLKSVASFIEESDLDAYAIGVMDDAPPLLGAIVERIDKKLLNKLTNVTGGRTVVIENAADLPDTAARLSQEMRSQYVLGYRPTDGGHDRRWRKIQVKLKTPSDIPLRAYYKKTYFTPGD